MQSAQERRPCCGKLTLLWLFLPTWSSSRGKTQWREWRTEGNKCHCSTIHSGGPELLLTSACYKHRLVGSGGMGLLPLLFCSSLVSLLRQAVTLCLSLPRLLCSHPSSVHLALGKSGVCYRAQMCIRPCGRRRTGSHLPFISADVSLWRWDLHQVPFNCSSLPPGRVVFVMSGLATVERKESYHLPDYSDTLCMYVVFNQAD